MRRLSEDLIQPPSGSELPDEQLIRVLIRAWKTAIRRAAKDAVTPLFVCYEPHGDGAQMAFDQAMDEAIQTSWEDHTDANFWRLVEIARARKLDLRFLEIGDKFQHRMEMQMTGMARPSPRPAFLRPRGAKS